jgi:two-component system chemotaxis response regulator CheB
MKKINVLVVDDSALMRKVISDMINDESDMEVVDICRNGEELLQKLPTCNADVITLDVEMPKMDGITALKQMKASNINIPAIMLSSLTKEGTQLTMECLKEGAFDFLPKPSEAISFDLIKIKNELIQKIRLAYGKKSSFTRISIRGSHIKETITRDSEKRKIESVVIGASTGGPKALYTVITALPKDLNVPVLVVQHMPAGFTKAFSERLCAASRLKVVEAEDGMPIERNVVYIAPGGFHMEVQNDKRIHLNSDPPIWGVRPAVDKLFTSASKVYGSHLISVVLTGMGRDGAQGTIEVKNSGGITISEDESTCTIYGMPRTAFETGKVDIVLPLNNVAGEIEQLVANGGR